MGTPVFSADGKRVAYVARKDEKWLVVLDGRPGPEYDEIMEGLPVFSPDGKRVAYAAMKDEKWLLVLDGRAEPGVRRIMAGTPVFSPDGKRARLRRQERGKWFVVLDGQPGPEYDGIMAGTPVFSPDGKRCAYGAKTLASGPSFSTASLGRRTTKSLASRSIPTASWVPCGPRWRALPGEARPLIEPGENPDRCYRAGAGVEPAACGLENARHSAICFVNGIAFSRARLVRVSSFVSTFLARFGLSVRLRPLWQSARKGDGTS